jgi:hypothetical protein
MMTIVEIASGALRRCLIEDYRTLFGSREPIRGELLGAAAEIATECLGNSDALYHNLEHTMLVTLVGRDIFRGRALTAPVTPSDWMHFMVACLVHDIGYVRGVLSGDRDPDYVVDAGGRTIRLSRGASDAALAPYHVDRSKMFILERLRVSEMLDAERIARAIEYTRFPVQQAPADAETGEETGLVRAADLIGQLGDPMYLRKTVALHAEFEEIGVNRQLGYGSPADLVEKYPDFFWRSVSPYLQDAIRYLNVTVSGRQWIAHLHHNVFCAEKSLRFRGPQR